MESKVLRWNFIFQYGWTLTNIINALILLPMYLNHIDASTLGVWLATGAILGWMTLIDPGMGELIQQRIAELRGRDLFADVAKTIGSGFLAAACILLISLVFGFACYIFVGTIIDKDISRYPHLAAALRISIFATGLSLVSFTVNGINQGLHNAAPVAIAALAANFLFLLINIALLYSGLGVMSIALANLGRALFVNVYGIIALLRFVRGQELSMVMSWTHFRDFIKIFSFTSASKILTGLSNTVDMLVLARFIPPAMITMYEINKRPVNISSALIGRHSVALMALISHARGRGDKAFILDLIYRQFKFYLYAALLIASLFIFYHEDLIMLWTGAGHYAGNTVVFLLVAVFFFYLMGYFMSNVGYALGDIRAISLYSICRATVFGITMFFTARTFGIPGTLIGSLSIVICGDLIFYGSRLFKLGYLDTSLLKRIVSTLAWVVPVVAPLGFLVRAMVYGGMPESTLSRLILGGSSFVLAYVTLILIVDPDVRSFARQLVQKLFRQKRLAIKKS